MSIIDFHARHGDGVPGSMGRMTTRREAEREVDDLLHTRVGTGLLLKDLLSNDGLLDQISPELRDAFAALMKDKAGTYGEIRRTLLKTIESGDASVLGLVNRIKGQVGENTFMAGLGRGTSARLASLGNQEAWDVAIDHEWGTQYVQVKTYSDANGVIRHMREIKAKLDGGRAILDGEKIVGRIDFAVPKDIAGEVARKAEALGLDVHVIPVETTAREAAEVVRRGLDNVGPKALQHFAKKMMGVAGKAAVMHGLASACLVYTGAKRKEDALGDVTQSTAITVAGATAGASVELVLKRVALSAGPAGWLVLGTSMTTMAMLRRVLERTDYAVFLREKNDALEKLTNTLLAV